MFMLSLSIQWARYKLARALCLSAVLGAGEGVLRASNKVQCQAATVLPALLVDRLPRHNVLVYAGVLV
jgi:hypothetical protein